MTDIANETPPHRFHLVQFFRHLVEAHRKLAKLILPARLHAFIGRLPMTPADRWLRRLSTYANKGRLWLVIAAAEAAMHQRRGAVHGGT